MIADASADITNALGDSLMAATMEGSKMSVVVGKNAAIAKIFKNDKLTVDVNMPEISMPSTTVNVYIGETELRKIVRDEVIIRNR